MVFLKPSEIISACLGPGLESCGGLWSWFLLSGAALATSGVLLAFLYTWSVLFRNSPLEGYVRQELLELFISALLLIFIFGAIQSVDSLRVDQFIPASLLPTDLPGDSSLFDAPASYFERVGDDMAGWLELNYVLNMYIDQIASVTPYARPLGVGLVASPLAGMASPIKQLLYNMSVALSIAFVVNYAQLFVYIFSIQAFLKYYLPAGIFLRCFTPTRRLGGTLIGIGVAFLFVFPALTTISYCMMYSNSGPLVTFRGLLGDYVSDFMSGDFSNFFGGNFAGGGVTDLVTGFFGGIGNLLQNVVGKFFLSLLIFPMSIISLAFAIGFVIPAFNIIVFTQAAKGLSKSFGEEVDISSLTRLI